MEVREQTKWESLKEALTNIAIGYSVNFAANLVILPLVGLPVTLAQNLVIGICFTLVSVFRSYVIRRWFNKLQRKKAA